MLETGKWARVVSMLNRGKKSRYSFVVDEAMKMLAGYARSRSMSPLRNLGWHIGNSTNNSCLLVLKDNCAACWQ